MLHRGNTSTLVFVLSQCPLNHFHITLSPSPARTLTPYPPHCLFGCFFLTLLAFSLPQLPLASSHSPSKLDAIIPFFLFFRPFIILPPTFLYQDLQAQPCSPLVLSLSSDTGNVIHSSLLFKRELHCLMYVQGEYPSKRQITVNSWTIANRRHSSSGKPGQEDHQKHGLQPISWAAYA